MKSRIAMLAIAAGLSARAFAQCPPANQAAVPQSPVNANVVSPSVVFNWTPSTASGVTGYDVIAGMTVGNATSVCNASGANANSCTASSMPAGVYSWKVRANIGVSPCPGLDSSLVSFSVGCPQTPPALTFPAAGATNVSQTPTLQWNAVTDANTYDIYLGAAGSGACTSGPVGTSSSTSFTPPQLPAGTMFEWRVAAKRSSTNCPTMLSSCQTFTTSGTACAPAGQFNLAAPANNATVINPVTLSWTPSANAAQYYVHLGTTNPPPTLTTTSPVNAPTTTFNAGSLAPGTYYWQIGAVPACGLAGKTSTNISSFVVACPTAPALDAPVNNAMNVAPLVKFDWEPSPGATSYRLNAILNGNNAPTVLTTTRDTEYTATVPAGLIEWWVDALADKCPDATSAHFKFTVGNGGCPNNPGVPTLISPANGATGLNSPVTFQWNGVQGATGYRVWGSSASSTESFFIGATTGATTLAGPVPQGVISWFVEARFGDCPSTVSRPFTMTVASGASCGNNLATALLAPANNATGVDSSVDFKWTEVKGAIGYQLYINNELSGFTTDTTLTRLVGDGKNTWRVDTMYVGCPSVRTADFAFTVGTAPCAQSSGVTLTAPANNATVTSPVTLSWSAPAGATYRIWASFDGGAVAPVGRTNATTKTLSFPSGTIEWFVETLPDSSTCPSVFSAHSKFIVAKGVSCDTHRPVTLVGPINGAQSDKDVTFSWTATDTVLLYRLWVSMNSGPFEDIGVTTDTQLQRKLPPGNGVWYVESFFENCPSMLSARGTFTIPAPPRCNVAPPLLVAPADGANNVTSPVTFVWSAVPEADDYRVFVSLGGADFVQIAETDDVTSITEPLPSGSYRWYVEAVLDSCPAVRSDKSRFTIPRAQNCATDAPQLIAPPDGATNVTSPVTLDWTPVSGAIGYVVFARVNDGAITRVEKTTATRLSRHFPDGRTEWWVVVLLNGCPSIESRHSTFTISDPVGCDNRKPLLYSPPDHAAGIVSPVRFVWSAVPRAKLYKLWAAFDEAEPSVIGSTTDTKLTISVPSGPIRWFIEVTFDNCPSVQSAVSSFTALKTPPPCAPPQRQAIHAPGQVASGTAYNVRWTAVANSSSTEVQESATADFASPSTQVTSDLFATFTHVVSGTPQRWFYRVRAISNCLDERGPYSAVAAVVVLPDAPRQHTSFEAGASAATQKVFITGQNPPVTFSARTDKPWATVSPATGTVGPAGVTLTVTYDPVALKLGTNTATVIVTYGGVLGKVGTTDVAPKTSVPVSVSTVTPVTPGGKSGPPPNSLIIPVIGHAAGQNNSLFESDVRVANTAATTAKYQLNFTLSGSDGTQSGQSTTIQVSPGETMALDDILTSFFGVGSDGSSATGVLEIRPLTSTSTSVTSSSVNVQTTVASSRTYNTTPTGTFGQYIPAILFSQFIGKTGDGAANTRITLQQIAQSSAYRTNLGITEGAGEPATVLVHVFDVTGLEVAAPIPFSLLPGEHKQINSILAANNISLTDGRFEIEVTSPTGKVTAYASTVDNFTNDPLCVFPVQKGTISSSRYVVPGVADINNAFAAWRSDMRVYNSGTADVTATFAYFPQPGNNGATSSPQITIKAGEVKVINNALQTLYGLSNSGGSIIISTPSPSSLVVTARTFNQTSNGTYGQFIPAVTPADAAGAGERTLQLLQLEQSDRFRSNIGLAETTGNPATVEISAIVPDSKVAVKTQFTLAANQFLQTTLGTGGFNLTNAYNVRVTVRVLSGSGRVTAYGSMIDQLTQDPTYVPSQ